MIKRVSEIGVPVEHSMQVQVAQGRVSHFKIIFVLVCKLGSLFDL